MLYNVVRQRAGPMVKECRYFRPRRAGNDTPFTTVEKNKIIRPVRAALARSTRDRLELRLALFGFEGRFYTLTFDENHLPRDFNGVRRALRAFLARLKRAKGSASDYAYCVEGKHGDHRFHIHIVLRDSDFPPDDTAALWTAGFTHSEPLLVFNGSRCSGGYRRIASYMCKERAGGVIPLGRHPWSVSRSLSRALPPPQRWKSEDFSIFIPDSAVWAEKSNLIQNEWGCFQSASYITSPEAWARSFAFPPSPGR